jgi:hypothetical protein
MSPLPWDAEVELKSCFQLPGVGWEPELLVCGVNSQSKLNVPLEVVFRSEELPKTALSLIAMLTVRMSPTWAMR